MSARTRHRRSNGHLVVRVPPGRMARSTAHAGPLCGSGRRAGRRLHREALEQFGVDTWITCDDDVATGTIVVLVAP